MSAETPEPPSRDPRGRDRFTERHVRKSEDLNRQSIGNIRQESLALRQELRADIEKVSDASRARDRELHEKLDRAFDKLDDRLDVYATQLTEVRTQLKTLTDQNRDAFADVPWYARPSYLKAMGLAIAAILASLIASLGLVFGWGRTGSHPHAPPPKAEASEEPAHGE